MQFSPIIRELPTRISELRLFVPNVLQDDRGCLSETYSAVNYGVFGIYDTFVQDLVTWSRKHVVRGPHYDFTMTKFVQVLKGQVYDIVVDMRAESATFKQWEAFDLSAENHRQLYVPKGFAHGFLTLTEEVIFLYKMSAQHNIANERRINWRDPSIGIAWPVSDVLISDKDGSLTPE